MEEPVAHQCLKALAPGILVCFLGTSFHYCRDLPCHVVSDLRRGHCVWRLDNRSTTDVLSQKLTRRHQNLYVLTTGCSKGRVQVGVVVGGQVRGEGVANTVVVAATPRVCVF